MAKNRREERKIKLKKLVEHEKPHEGNRVIFGYLKQKMWGTVPDSKGSLSAFHTP